MRDTERKESKAVLISKGYHETILSLTDKQAGQWIKALMSYAVDHVRPEPSEIDQVVQIVFNITAASVDANEETYQKRCEQAKAAVNTRWKKDQSGGNT